MTSPLSTFSEGLAPDNVAHLSPFSVSIEMPVRDLARIAKAIGRVVSPDASRGPLAYALLDLGRGLIEATDGHRLLRVYLRQSSAPDGRCVRCLLPPAFLDKVAKLKPAKGQDPVATLRIRYRNRQDDTGTDVALEAPGMGVTLAEHVGGLTHSGLPLTPAYWPATDRVVPALARCRSADDSTRSVVAFDPVLLAETLSAMAEVIKASRYSYENVAINFGGWGDPAIIYWSEDPSADLQGQEGNEHQPPAVGLLRAVAAVMPTRDAELIALVHPYR